MSRRVEPQLHDRRRRVAVVGAVIVLVLAACAPDDEPVGEPSPTPTPQPTLTETPTPTPLETWPLTGLPAPDGLPDHPVLVVKVDNSRPARPQVGLSHADLVVEELVEGGMTRLAAMYHGTLPDEVTPVRSIRTTDIGIVTATGGALVASGGAQRVLRMMDDAGITVLQEGDPGFTRAGGRSAPYNVTVDLTEVVDAAAHLDPPPWPYLEWAEPDADPPSGDDASTLTVRYSGAHATTWEWDDGAWAVVDDLAAEGDEFRADTVLALTVAIQDAGYTDPAGNPVPESVLEGSGEAVLFTEGLAVSGEWSRADLESAFALTDADGDRLPVPPGRTWIALVPEAGSVGWAE